jgi:plastocyanin
MRKFLVFLSAIGLGGSLLGENVTLPAAASIQGGAPFFSDVRAFNTSYTDDLTVEARYRCFIPSPCTPGTNAITFTLAPRESRAFDDIVVSQFNSPNTAGGVEFEFSGDSDQLVVTSRLYSTEPEPTVGMFIPGLKNSEAHETTVLTSIRNGGPNAGFRTNVGVFNREDSSVDVTFTIISGGAQVGNPVSIQVAGHSGAQVSGIFTVAGQAGAATDNAVIVVSASHEVFSYAAVIDNATTDPIFVVGAEDRPQQPITPTGPTVTPTQPAASPTPTRTVTPTPPAGGVRDVTVGGTTLTYRDSVSGNSVTTITVGQTVRWNWAGGQHSVSSTGTEAFESGEHEGTTFTFSHTFNQAGTFPYLCSVHGTFMSGSVHVNP